MTETRQSIRSTSPKVTVGNLEPPTYPGRQDEELRRKWSELPLKAKRDVEAFAARLRGCDTADEQRREWYIFDALVKLEGQRYPICAKCGAGFDSCMCELAG